MADYWGARAYYFSGGPNGEGTRYTMPEPSNVEFTMPRGENNGTTIETIRQRLLNQHPEDISALADQWQNAYNLLSSIRAQLLDTSNTLYNEHWRSAEARDAFMKKGPGETLAYLDEWMDAAANNVSALRALVGIATTARSDMEDLWSEYEREIEEASHAGGWTRAAHGALWGVTLTLYDADAGIRGSESEAVQEKQREFNGRAQDLAHRVADEYFETFSKVSGGHGPPFLPMDAVFNPVNGPPWLTNLGRPATPPPPNAPAVPPVPVPTAPNQQVTAPADPLLRRQQVLANLQRQSVTPQPVPRPAPAPGAPPLPAAVPGSAEAPGLPGDATTAATAPPPPGMVAPASRAPSGTPALPNPAGLQKGVLGRPAPSQPTGTLPPGPVKSPGRTLARPTPGTAQPPSAAPPPGRTLGRKEPAAPGTGKDQRSRVAGPAGVEEQFARPPASTAPPVLNNQRPTQRRPGSPAESAPTTKRGGTTDVPTLAHPDTAPPVLNRPARVPERSGPVTGKRPERGATARPGGSGPAQPPGTEWVGVEAAREDATTPVLDAPAPPVGGATSKLEEVPSKLRGRRPTAARPTAARPSRGAVPPELAARQTSPGSGSGTPATSRAEDEPAIVTDEEAFNVETPGGGVLANRRDDTPHRPEPPTALRGN